MCLLVLTIKLHVYSKALESWEFWKRICITWCSFGIASYILQVYTKLSSVMIGFQINYVVFIHLMDLL